jgi:ABC-type multidrug transport system fused ATPase/permease subunit
MHDFFRELHAVVGAGWQRLAVVGILILASTALDVIGVAMVAPFLSMTIGGERGALAFPVWLRRVIGNGTAEFGFLLLGVFLVKGYAAYRVQRSITHATESERARLMTRLLTAYQARPYEYHLSRNSSELINLIVYFTQAFTGGILANLLQLVANGLVFVALAVYLAVTNLFALLLLALVLFLVFLAVTYVIRPRLASASEHMARLNADVMHSVTQALGALREVRILGREGYFRERLQRAADQLVSHTALQSSMQLVPRQAIEVAMVGFLVTLVWLAHREQAATLLPLLGTFGAAALRLMPASTSLLNSWNLLRANRFTVTSLARELEAEPSARDILPTDLGSTPDHALDAFHELTVDKASFSYLGTRSKALSDVSLTIRAGEVVGLMGRSGAGKSTLADIILGLLRPTSGTVRVNGWDINDQTARWQRMVAYIPQTVYLLDDSLRRNIALGVSDADIENSRINDAVQQAQLTELVTQLPQGLDTQVGERGVRLSGGQRQRIAIARALYHDRQFLMFDEATSALDAETERSVVSAMGGLTGQKTLVVIAHRESTLTACNRIIQLADGQLLSDRSMRAQGYAAPLRIESTEKP